MHTVISGGQTGVDQGALVAARSCGLPTGGWAPRGWRTDIGPNPALADYGLQQHESSGYALRTEANVRDADATLILADLCNSPGSRLTWRLAHQLGKPVLLLPWGATWSAADVRTWCAQFGVVNVAGPRERSYPGAYARTYLFLFEAWK